MYKGEQFYNEYFSHLDEFKLIEEFSLCKDSDKKNTFVGVIEAINTIHPLKVKVEIPVTFPHNKLLFTTSSLFGYPHLIPIKAKDGQYNSWFCLNSPFAETAEQQLNIELERLLGWIKNYMTEDLPAIIEDKKLRKSLSVLNAYGWENVDEMNEFRKDAMLTFVGDFAIHPTSFKEKKGHLYCMRNGSNKFFAFETSLGTDGRSPWKIELP